MYSPILAILLTLFINYTVPVDSTNPPEDNFEMSYFEDVASSYTLEAVQEEKFTQNKEHLINLGITKSTLWIKIKLNTRLLLTNAVLEVKTPFKDSITLYYTLKNNSTISTSLGIAYPYSKNKLSHYLPAFEIPTDQLANPTVYLKIKSRYSMLVPIHVKTKENFFKERVSAYLIGGLFIGGLLLMGGYNLFLFFSTRDLSYLIYVLALLSALLSQGYLLGLLIPILSPESPEFSFRFPIIIMSCTGMFSSLFTIRFLDIRKTSTFLFYLLLFAISLWLVNISLELLHVDYLSRKLNILLVIFNSFVIFSTALYCLIKGHRIALYFTIAWTFYLLGLIIYSFKTIGIILHNSFTDHLMNVGTFMEVMLLSFALGHKYNLIQKDKEKLERQTRAELEVLVKSQTKELEASLKEKEILLTEVHHRVKNNLQIVISLLDLQGASITDKKNKEVLFQSKSRIYSMSLIHQKLYQSDNLACVNMKSYLEELFSYVQNSAADPSKKTTHTLLLEEQDLSITKAVPLGLIVNELLTNSFKYGIQKEAGNEINMSLKLNDNMLVLEVSDSGKGFDENKKNEGVKKSLGLFLIKSLTKQLRASSKRFYHNDLFVTQISIPLASYEK